MKLSPGLLGFLVVGAIVTSACLLTRVVQMTRTAAVKRKSKLALWGSRRDEE